MAFQGAMPSTFHEDLSECRLFLNRTITFGSLINFHLVGFCSLTSHLILSSALAPKRLVICGPRTMYVGSCRRVEDEVVALSVNIFFIATLLANGMKLGLKR